MTWWIAFTIAVLGWYFTAKQNGKNSARSLVNQEIKETRIKLHELIISVTDHDVKLPISSTSESYIKMQIYIVAVNELDTLYSSYHLSHFFQNIKIVNATLANIAKLFELGVFKRVKEFFTYWFLPPQPASKSTFNLSKHISSFRQSLTDDIAEINKDQRLAELNLHYKKLCIAYQFVS